MFSKSDLVKLIIPLMIEQTLALSMVMIDMVMVAGAGESVVSGVSLVGSIDILLINLFSALATGGAIVSGQYLGKKDKESAGHAAKQLVIATLFFSSLIMLVCLSFNSSILSLFFGKIETDVMNHAQTYFYMTVLSYPFIALFNSAAALFRIMGNSKIAMINALIMNVVNIAGNAVFIYALDLNAFGAGLATLIARMIAAISMMWMLRNPGLDIFVRSYHFKDINTQMIKLILKIGVPNGLENSIFQFGRIIVTSLVAIHGTAAIAAHAVATSLTCIEIIPGYALGLAIMTVVARCVGAKEYEQANNYIKHLMKLAYISMIILNVGILIIIKPVLGLYQLSTETYNLALQIIIIHGVAAMVIWPVSFTLPNAFRAAGDVKYPMYISILSMWIFRIGCSYLFVYIFELGVLSVWISMVADWIARSAFFVRRWLNGRWKNYEVV